MLAFTFIQVEVLEGFGVDSCNTLWRFASFCFYYLGRRSSRWIVVVTYVSDTPHASVCLSFTLEYP